jgi:outer membrane lipoprotein-sorting protein
MDHMEAPMKSILAIMLAALLFVMGCAGDRALTPEELEAIKEVQRKVRKVERALMTE